MLAVYLGLFVPAIQKNALMVSKLYILLHKRYLKSLKVENMKVSMEIIPWKYQV